MKHTIKNFILKINTEQYIKTEIIIIIDMKIITIK